MAIILASLLDPFLLVILVYVLVKKIEVRTAAMLGGGLFAFHFVLMAMNPMGIIPSLVAVKLVVDPSVLSLAAFARQRFGDAAQR